MAHIFESRCVSEGLTDPVGVTRVACIGDSMMYGFGGPSRHALPHQLCRLLNAAFTDKLIFVDNFGQTSGNLWNAWTLFQGVRGNRHIDALVFSVCQNDLELFAGNLVRYGSDRLDTFLEGTPTRAAGCDLLREVASWRAATGTDVLIIFYTYHPGDRPMIDHVARMCDEFDLPFIDMLHFFRTETGLTVETFRVTEFDGHPSELGHQLAARRISREFVDRGFLRGAAEVGENLGAALGDSLRSLIDQGVPADAALLWGFELCAAKAVALRRAHAASAKAAECTELKEETAKGMIRWRNGLRQRVRGAALQADPVVIAGDNYLANMAAHRSMFEEILQVLTAARPATDMSRIVGLFDDTAHSRGSHYPSFDGNLALVAKVARQKIDAAMASLGLVPDRRARVAFNRSLGDLPGLDREQGVEGLLNHQVFALEQQIVRLESYAARFPQGVPRGRPEYRLMSIAFLSLNEALLLIDRLARKADEALSLGTPHGLPWTIVSVTVEGAVGQPIDDRHFDLVAELHYQIPRRGIIRERQNAGAVKERATYTFEFPLMLGGDVIIYVPERGMNRELFTSGKARFARIEIGNADWDGHVADRGKTVLWESNLAAKAVILLQRIQLS